MTALADLDTPVVTVDLDTMRDNIHRVQAHLSRHGIANRPHIKTHKIPEIGKMQIAAGASGITCQKLGEVEVFVDAGVTDDPGDSDFRARQRVGGDPGLIVDDDSDGRPIRRARVPGQRQDHRASGRRSPSVRHRILRCRVMREVRDGG
jgi:hypothetical protein